MKITKLSKSLRKILPLQYCGAVIVAAGTASRMGGIDKVMAPLGGEPMIVRTVRAFQQCDAIREIVIVTREDLLQALNRISSMLYILMLREKAAYGTGETDRKNH